MQTIANMYSHLALSYRRWHYRMTTSRTERPGGPAIGLSAFHALNAFSLLFLLPPRAVPEWLFTSFPLVVGICAYAIAGRIYDAHPAQFAYAKLRDHVPGLREFPLVYAYLFGTLAFFVFCVCWAINRAA